MVRPALSAIFCCEGSNAGGLWGTAGESSFLMYDGARQTYKAVVLAMPGLGLDASQWAPSADASGCFAHVREIVRAGYIVLAINGGSLTSWPAPAMNTIMDAAITAVLARFSAKLPTAWQTKVLGLGFSRGCDSWLDYLVQPAHTARCGGLFGFSASPDLSWAEGRDLTFGANPNAATWAPQIYASYGCTALTYPAATAGYRMMDNAASYAGLCPIHFTHAGDDPVVPVAIPTAWVAAVAAAGGSNATLHLTATGGHGNFLTVGVGEAPAFYDAAIAA